MSTKLGCKRGPFTMIAAGTLCCVAIVQMAACGAGAAPEFKTDADAAPGDQALGERLFLETRFAEYFAVHNTGINTPLAVGDPVVAQVQTTNGPLPGPFAGQSINCRSCHFVTEFQGVSGAGNRTYADFTDHSPLPLAMNGFTHTPRNAMQMVGSLQPHPGPAFLHFDGQFVDPSDLVETTLTGRNFGWAPNQYQQALANIAAVIRGDDGSGELARERSNGLSYATMFLGTDPRIPPSELIPVQYRLDVNSASDQKILDDIAKLISSYMYGLVFKQDEFGRYIASPYDVFLRMNHLPVQPTAGQSPQQYNQVLFQAMEKLTNPIFVSGADGQFQYHAQPFQFGAMELAGLQIFLRQASNATDGSQHAGNCAVCHLPPNFTDFSFHNTGVSQEEYDSANGMGAFMNLAIPSLAQRNQDYDLYLPVTPNHPNASESFRHPAVAGNPQYADLGLWNVYLNPDLPNPQQDLAAFVCASSQNCAVDQGLATTIAQFKTPTLRDLEDSAPYLHNGSMLLFPNVVELYVANSQLARQGQLRHPPVEFQNMSISQSDVDALAAFLASLTEDYDDN